MSNPMIEESRSVESVRPNETPAVTADEAVSAEDRPQNPIEEEVLRQHREMIGADIPPSMAMSEGKLLRSWRVYAKYIDPKLAKGSMIVMGVLMIYHIVTSADKRKAVYDTAAMLAIFSQVDKVVGKAIKQPGLRIAVELAATLGIAFGGAKLIDAAGINFNSRNKKEIFSLVGSSLEIVGAQAIYTPVWNFFSTPDEERAFLDVSIVDISHERLYLNTTGEWNEKVKTEIANRKTRIEVLRQTKPKIHVRKMFGEATEYVQDSPEEVAGNIKTLEAEISAWEKKYIDEGWDKRQAFSLKTRVVRFRTLKDVVATSAESSATVSNTELLRLNEFLGQAESQMISGQSDIPNDVYDIVRKAGDETWKSFKGMMALHEQVADDFSFFRRIGRKAVLDNWNGTNEDFRQQAIAFLRQDLQK